MWNFTYALDILLATHSKPRCGGPNVNEVANYLAYFLPMLLVIVCNPFFFYYTAKKVKSLVTQQHGRYSVREQVLVHSAKAKFSMIIFVFIAW
ncbi:G-protein coupled receptor 143 [Octopus bimaculoides]|nr:G-protein coupled receptor 143 [Octopus bimaculoides]